MTMLLRGGKVKPSQGSSEHDRVKNVKKVETEKRMGKFSAEEDAVILNCIEVHGLNFKKMTSYLTGRSVVQLKSRHKLLQKLQVTATWTEKDDRKLMQLIAYQDSGPDFAKAAKQFPGRDRHNIRSRYWTLWRWMESHPYEDLALAPRRSPRRFIHGAPCNNLVEALKNFKKKMQSEVESHRQKIKEKKILSRNSNESQPNDAIMKEIAIPKARNRRIARSRITVADKSTTPVAKINYFNLKNLLYILKADLDKDKFYSSEIGKKFKEIEDADSDPSDTYVVPHVLKSYPGVKAAPASKGTLEPLVKPDLFGTVITTDSQRLFLPPNYTTITAGSSLLLLKHLCSKNNQNKGQAAFLTLMRNNRPFNIAMTRMKKRAVSMFFWPFLLSYYDFDSYGPSLPLPRRESSLSKHGSLYVASGVAIPAIKAKQLCDDEDDPSIDIDVQVEDNSKDINIDLEKLISESPFNI